MHRTAIICLFLITSTIVVYGQVITFDFVNYDDNVYVTENTQIQEGLTPAGLKWALTSSGRTANWHPVTWLSHMLDCHLYGLNPGGHHATNVVFHVLNTLLLFGLLTSATGRHWPSAVVAALFALHPLRVESVAWVAERKDVLSTFFGLLAMWSYGTYAKRGGWWRYLLTGILLALGLMAKPMLVTLPLVMLLWDYWPLGRFQPVDASSRQAHPPEESAVSTQSFGRLLIEKVPLLALSVVSSVVTVIVQASAGATATLERIPIGYCLANTLVSYVRYMGKLIWPSDLSIHYPHPNLSGGTPWASWQIVGAGLLLIAITVAAVRATRKPYLAVGWLWYLGTLVPVIGLVQVGSQAISDRYTYLPSIGLLIVVAWGGADLVSGARRHQGLIRAVAAALATIILVTFMVCTWSQARHWRDSISLYDRALEVTSDSANVYHNRGEAYMKLGDYEQAFRDYATSLRLDPTYIATYGNRGIAYQQLDQHERAAADFSRVIELKPELAEPYYNRGNSYRQLGRNDLAINDYLKAIELEPEAAETYNSRGITYMALGNHPAAFADFAEAIRLNPEFVEAYHNRGKLYRKVGQQELALRDFDEALRLRPDYALAYQDRGTAYLKQGRPSLARDDFTKLLKITPDDAVAHNNRGSAYLALDDYESAIKDYSQAIRLNPHYALAYYNRGIVHRRLGQSERAAADFDRAVELKPELRSRVEAKQ